MKGERMLDTQSMIWLATNDPKLDTVVVDDIAYFQHPYCVSILSWIEFSHLLKNRKLKGVNIDLASARKLFDRLMIHTYLFDESDMNVLDSLPILTIGGTKHADPFDRGIIAQAMNAERTLISSDKKFPSYRRYGLDLIEVGALLSL